ncbi:DUF2683 family protein [Candidatus Woesearchaeota archaeon]|nr:DUF2683 family protein [Candidatus Woesearchaeota archaeon]
MVQALVELDENTNRVLNMVKATYDLKDKGEAISFVVSEYIEFRDEPELRPEFIERMLKQKDEKGVFVGSVDDFRKKYGLKKR